METLVGDSVGLKQASGANYTAVAYRPTLKDPFILAMPLVSWKISREESGKDSGQY